MCYFEIAHIMVHIMSSETRAMCCFTLTNARKCLHLWIKYSPCILTFKCALCKSFRMWPHHRHPKPLSPPAWITALPSVTLVASFWKSISGLWSVLKTGCASALLHLRFWMGFKSLVLFFGGAIWILLNSVRIFLLILVPCKPGHSL